jgi:hypothetical protein
VLQEGIEPRLGGPRDLGAMGREVHARVNVTPGTSRSAASARATQEPQFRFSTCEPLAAGCRALRHRVAGRVHGRPDGIGLETGAHDQFRAAGREVHGGRLDAGNGGERGLGPRGAAAAVEVGDVVAEVVALNVSGTGRVLSVRPGI